MCHACGSSTTTRSVCGDRVLDYLRELYLFRTLTSEQLARVVDGTRTTRLEDGQWLFARSDPAERFYVVRCGEIALFLLSPSGKESVVALIGADEMFEEELAFLDDPQHGINARAVGECTLLSLDRRSLRALLLECPELAMPLVATQHRRQRFLLDHIERLTLQDATERLVLYLLAQVEGNPDSQRVRLRVPKQTLAAHLSIQPETLSRILQRLKVRKYVAQDGDGLLVDTDLLRHWLGCEQCALLSWGCPGPERARCLPATDS